MFENDFFLSGNDFAHGEFQWSDGSLVPLPGEPNQKWADTQPDNTGIGNCILAQKDQDGYSWRDVLCSDVNFALCEKNMLL